MPVTQEEEDRLREQMEAQIERAQAAVGSAVDQSGDAAANGLPAEAQELVRGEGDEPLRLTLDKSARSAAPSTQRGPPGGAVLGNHLAELEVGFRAGVVGMRFP